MLQTLTIYIVMRENGSFSLLDVYSPDDDTITGNSSQMVYGEDVVDFSGPTGAAPLGKFFDGLRDHDWGIKQVVYFGETSSRDRVVYHCVRRVDS